MLALSKHPDLDQLDERLCDAPAVTSDLMTKVIGETCRRVPSMGHSEKTARIERLIQSAAWTDAALALVDLELPQWRVRRIAYDEGEWHCALSRQRELPEWLDQSIEAHHVDLSLAILRAFVDAQRASAPTVRTSVPMVPHEANSLYEPILADNFA